MLIDKIGVDSLEELVDMFEDSEWEQILSMYKIIEVIGSGGFGVVLSAIDLRYNKKIALKICLKKDLRGDILMKEYNILKELNHPNIIKLYSILNFSNYLIMTLKLCGESVYEY
jgi:eukaryotic-like serine/threonine-protein kinase